MMLADLYGLQTDQPLPPTIGDDEMRRAISERVRQAMGPITTGPLPVQAQELPAAEPVRDYANTPAQGGYVPSMGSMSARPQPVAAPAPQPVAVASAQPRQATLSDRLTGFAEGYQSGGLIGAIGRAGEGVDKKIETENLTIRTLMSKGGLSRDDATAVSRNPKMLEAAIGTMFGPKTAVHNNRLVDMRTGDVIADFSDSARQGPEIKTIELPDGEKMSVVWDAKAGRHVPVDGSAAGAVEAGSKSTAGAAGDPKSKQFRQAEATTMGKSQGEARAILPSAISASALLTKHIDEILNHPSLDAAVGPIDGRASTFLPATKDVETRIAQLKGGAFLQAFNTLRGAGAISNAEGQTATTAQARLDVTQGQEGFKQALKDYKAEIDLMTKTARERAGLATEPVAVTRIEEALKLPKGTPFVTPDGRHKVR